MKKSRTLTRNRQLWKLASQEGDLYNLWLEQLDASWGGLIYSVVKKPEFFNADAINSIRVSALETFLALFDAAPGSRFEKFLFLGSPAALSHVLRHGSVAPAKRITKPAAQIASNFRPVREVGKRREWSSVAELARHLGCVYGTAHAHLRKKTPTLCGRVFEYVTPDWKDP